MASSSNGGSSIFGSICWTTFFVFLVLKLCNVITWSWWIVFIPVFIRIAIWVLLIAFIAWVGGLGKK